MQGCKRLSPGPRGAVAVSNRDPERTKTRLFDRRAKSNAGCILVVNGDAMLDQRDLSIPIVQAKGDYLWTVKDNQEGLREDIDVLFQHHRKRAGTSAPPNDFRTACSCSVLTQQVYWN